MTCSAVNKADDHFCGGCGANLPGISVGPEVSVPVIPSIPTKRPPPPAPAAHKRTVAIETVSDLVISEMPIG